VASSVGSAVEFAGPAVSAIVGAGSAVLAVGAGVAPFRKLVNVCYYDIIFIKHKASVYQIDCQHQRHHNFIYILMT
jgi:hypothetical protein